MKGYLPHAVVKAVVFWVLVACIASSTIAGLCLAWGGIGEVLARRWLWSAFILGGGSLFFLLTNILFGNLESHVFNPNRTTPPIDPAFADRLKRAKDFREEHDEAKKTG